MSFLAAAAAGASILGAGASVYSAAKGMPKQEVQSGFLGGDSASGNVLGNGAQEAVPTIEKLGLGTRVKSRVNQFLGSDAGRLGTDVGMQFLGDARQARNKKKHFEYLEGKGLNPWEAASLGGGAAGSVSPSSHASAPSSVSAGHPSLKMAAIAGRKEWIETEVIAAQFEKIQAESLLIKMNTEWLVPFKFAGMGMENMKAALATFNSPVDISRVLKAAGDATPAERAAGQELLETFLMISGSSGGAIGWTEWLRFLERSAGSRGVPESLKRDKKFISDMWNPGGLPNAIRNRRKN